MIVSPDVGGVARARAIAQRIGADLAIVDKRRPRAGVSEVMNIIGDVTGHDCILIATPRSTNPDRSWADCAPRGHWSRLRNRMRSSNGPTDPVCVRCARC